MERNLQLQRQADEALTRAEGHKKLCLIFWGITALVALLVELVCLLIDGGIAQTGGLSGMELRSLLETVQTMLPLLQAALLPFWMAGYTASMLRIAREQETRPAHLLTGFRLFGPVLRLNILIVIIGFVAAFLCVQVCTVILSFTPLSDQLYTLMMSQPENDPAVQEAILKTMEPIVWIISVFCLLALVPLSYFLRLARLRLLDAPKEGARQATIISIRLMRGNCLRLFLLDLRFWWFYLAQAVVVALAYGGELLAACGVSLPMSATSVFFLFYALSLGAELALFYCWRNRVDVTYAKFYLDLLPKEEPNEHREAVL